MYLSIHFIMQMNDRDYAAVLSLCSLLQQHLDLHPPAAATLALSA
jgi:hypothetical protein